MMGDFVKFDEMSEFNGQEKSRSNVEDPIAKTYGDRMFEQYEILASYDPENDIPSDDLLPHDTRISQSLSDEDNVDDVDNVADVNNEDNVDDADRSNVRQGSQETALEEDTLPDVPDADDIQPGSPPDPAAPEMEAMHGTDLINGAGADEEDAPPQGWFPKGE